MSTSDRPLIGFDAASPPAGRVWLGRLEDGAVGLADGERAGWVDVGHIGADGLAFAEEQALPGSYAAGGLIPTGEAVSFTVGPDEWVMSAADVSRMAATGFETGTAVDLDTGDTPPAGRDIVEQIDAAVDQLCACGCRRRLDPDGPSAYFYDAGCQHRWNGRQAIDPEDVYRRPDAAIAYVGADARRVPLHQPRPEQAADGAEQARRRLAEMQPARTDLAGCPDPYGAGYRRRCGRCATWGIPQVWWEEPETVDIYSWSSVLPIRYTSTPILRHSCGSCGEELAGRAYAADVVRRDQRRLVLSLSDGQARAQRDVSIRALERTDDPARFVRREWAALEDQLDRFRRAWGGRQEHRLAMRTGAGCVDPAATIHTTGQA